jgi:uncharacterized protein YyaL (SSP411 family)
MFVSAYLESARVLQDSLGLRCRAFALKTMDRMLAEAWSEEKGFAHRIGGPPLDGSLDDQVFGVLALLDSYEATLNEKYFRAALRTMDIAVEKYGDSERGGFFDRSSDAPPMGGLEVRRRPLQDSPTPGANSVATAHSIFRLGKSVMRILPGTTPASLPLALRETIPHLPADKAIALVCAGNTCFPPTSDPEQLKVLIMGKPSSAGAS